MLNHIFARENNLNEKIGRNDKKTDNFEKYFNSASCVHIRYRKFFETKFRYVCIWGLNIFMRTLLVFSVDFFKV